MNFKSEAQIRDAVEAGFAAKQDVVVLQCASQWEQRLVAKMALCVVGVRDTTQSDPETEVYEVHVFRGDPPTA